MFRFQSKLFEAKYTSNHARSNLENTRIGTELKLNQFEIKSHDSWPASKEVAGGHAAGKAREPPALAGVQGM